MTTTKFWLDDVRLCPFVGNWIVATDYNEAVELLKDIPEGKLEEVWFDHDLAVDHYEANMDPSFVSPNKTGMDVLKWMIENKKMPIDGDKVFVHSLNPVGSQRMCSMIGDYYNEPMYMHRRHYYSYLKIQSQLMDQYDKNFKIGQKD